MAREVCVRVVALQNRIGRGCDGREWPFGQLGRGGREIEREIG